MPDWELDLAADEVAQLIEAENRRSQELMTNMQKSYMEAIPPVGVQQPRDLFSKTNQIPQY